MNRKFPEDLMLYEAAYGSDLPIEQLFLFYFDAIVSKQSNKDLYDFKIVDYLLENGFEKESKVVRSRRNEDEDDHLFVNRKKHIIVRLYCTHDKMNMGLYIVDFYYDLKLGELDTQLNLNEFKVFQRKRTKGNISLVRMEMGHLDTQEYDLEIPDMDLGLNYGTKFEKVHDVIVQRLNKKKGKGIILLHGEPGTGKTSYLKYLTKLIDEKDILFIPPSMAETLSDPAIIPFLMDHKDSILIIEDAERVISDREGNGSPAGVSNVLNITDGILGDCLNIQIIATFNMKRERIDQALLRKGRLIAEHKFEKLTVDETNTLLIHLEKDVVVDKAMSLADIYNIDVEVFKSSNNMSKIGLY
jgi:hypothetical protein